MAVRLPSYRRTGPTRGQSGTPGRLRREKEKLLEDLPFPRPSPTGSELLATLKRSDIAKLQIRPPPPY